MHRTISLLGVVAGLALGIAAGLVYAWLINPRIVTNVNPSQLTREGRRNYVIALSMAWARDGDILAAANRLADAGLEWQDVADFACDLARERTAGTNAGLAEISSMIALAETQGRSAGCDLPVIYTNTPAPSPTFATPTETRPPPPSKTPTPTLGVTFTPPPLILTPTPEPPGEFTVDVRTFCDGEGRIEVLVQTANGQGVPGMAVVVQADQDRQTFFTGLKPERDLGYADFTMTPERSYVVSLRDFREARTRSLPAAPCTAGSPDRAGYRVTFRGVRGP
jgi:hypothetical protein